jgi:hypothetical protein
LRELKSKYIGIKVNGKKIDEHRYVWMQANGPIPKGMVIHHKNEDTHDNRLENLEMMTLKEHTSLHFKGKPFIPTAGWRASHRKVHIELSKDKDGLFWCYSCKQLLDKLKFTRRKDRLSGLEDICKPCRKKQRLETRLKQVG